MTKQELLNRISQQTARFYWSKGVLQMAALIVDRLDDETIPELNANNCNKKLLNGASDWVRYSEGGCALIYDDDIAKTLCSPQEYKRAHYKDGSLHYHANSRETWLKVQARALYQASLIIKNIIKEG